MYAIRIRVMYQCGTSTLRLVRSCDGSISKLQLQLLQPEPRRKSRSERLASVRSVLSIANQFSSQTISLLRRQDPDSRTGALENTHATDISSFYSHCIYVSHFYYNQSQERLLSQRVSLACTPSVIFFLSYTPMRPYLTCSHIRPTSVFLYTQIHYFILYYTLILYVSLCVSRRYQPNEMCFIFFYILYMAIRYIVPLNSFT